MQCSVVDGIHYLARKWHVLGRPSDVISDDRSAALAKFEPTSADHKRYPVRGNAANAVGWRERHGGVKKQRKDKNGRAARRAQNGKNREGPEKGAASDSRCGVGPFAPFIFFFAILMSACAVCQPVYGGA